MLFRPTLNAYHYLMGMAPTPPLPDAFFWRTVSPELQAAILVSVQRYEQEIAELKQQVQDLMHQLQEPKARLDRNSATSSKSSSADPVSVKRNPPAPLSQVSCRSSSVIGPRTYRTCL
jgi:Family of unknown function (DUF6444)